MDHELILRYVSTLGFPICAAMGLSWALWKIGSRLLDSHIQFVADIKENTVHNTELVKQIRDNGISTVAELREQTANIRKQTAILESPSTLLANVCKVEPPQQSVRRPKP